MACLVVQVALVYLQLLLELLPEADLFLIQYVKFLVLGFDLGQIVGQLGFFLLQLSLLA